MATFSTSEYTRTITVSEGHLTDMIFAQNKSNKIWDDKLSKSDYKAAIYSLGTTVLGFVFKTTAAGIIYTVMTSAIDWSSNSFAGGVADSIEDGKTYLIDLLELFEKHSSYKMIEVELPYLQLKNNSTGDLATVVTGSGIIKKIHTNNGGTIIP